MNYFDSEIKPEKKEREPNEILMIASAAWAFIYHLYHNILETKRIEMKEERSECEYKKRHFV